MSGRCFVAGTGTNIGKTLVTCALTHQLRTSGKNAAAIKPVISGFASEAPAESDTGLILAAQQMPPSAENIDAVSPWRFAAPLSPDMAASAEGKALDLSSLTAFTLRQTSHDFLLVETPGGVMTPLNATHTVLDWMADANLPVLLVAGSYLGTISHTLTAFHALAARGLSVAAIIISASGGEPVPFAVLAETLQRFLPEMKLHYIPRLDSSPRMWENAPDMTHLVP